MNKAYERINWKNYPSEETALNEDNLNKMDAALNEVDTRVVAHETTKLEVATANSMVRNISFNERTGIFTVTYLNGSTKELDTKLEKIATNFRYDYSTQKLILTLVDGTTQEIDMSTLITQYEFADSSYIKWTIMSDGKIKAEIINGSITADKLQPNFLADVTLQANSAKTSEQNAKVSEENAKQSEINAKNYADSAEPVASAENGLNPTLDNSTHAPFITFDGNGKTTQNIEKYLTKLSEVSDGVQTNIIDCKPGDEVVLDCGTKRSIGYYVYFEDNMSMYEENSAYVQAYTFTPGGKMQFIIKGGTVDDNIKITVNGSEYRNPSPDNPIEIHGVGKSGVLEVKSTGANIFGGLPFAQAIVDNFNGTLNEGEKTVGFTCSTALRDATIKNGGFKENTQYTFILKGMCTDSHYKFSNLTILYTDGTNSGNLQFPTAGSISTGEFTSAREKTIKSIAFIYGAGGTIFNYEQCGIFEGVITADEFEPYAETKADIPLSSPLYEKDYIKYRMDGSGEESHKMKAVVYDGSESGWFKNSSTGSYYIDIPNAKMGGAVWCSHYIYNSDNFAEGNIVIGSTSTKLFIMPTAAQNITTVDEWKTWLAENKPEVVYELAEPIVTELTAEQIAEFKKLQTFDGVTNVTCDGETEISYFADSAGGKAMAQLDKVLNQTISGVESNQSLINNTNNLLNDAILKWVIIEELTLTVGANKSATWEKDLSEDFPSGYALSGVVGYDITYKNLALTQVRTGGNANGGVSLYCTFSNSTNESKTISTAAEFDLLLVKAELT